MTTQARPKGAGEVGALLGGELPVSIGPMRQWAALSHRGNIKVFRNGEYIFAFVAPAFLAACFYLPLSALMNGIPGVDYASFLMPIIVLQSLAFVASASAMRAAYDESDRIHWRFRVLPMAAALPVLARQTTNALLLVISLGCAAGACLVIGWRPGHGVAGAVMVFAIAGVVGLLLCLDADALGLVSGSPQATSQAIALPALILGMLSTGFIPASRFPDWIEPFVREQPVSQVVNAMRAADSGSLTWQILAPTVYWCVGFCVIAATLFVLHARRSRR